MADVLQTPPQTPFQQTTQATEAYVAAEQQVAQQAASSDVVQWTASEFIAHDKTSIWYLALGAGALALSVLLYLLTKDKVTSAVVIVAALFLAYSGSRQPRQIQYVVNPQGITVGARQCPYALFRSFAVMREGAFSSIVCMPLKRFALPLSLYYDPKDEEKIMQILSNQLPFEQRKPDMVDSLMRRIRF